MKTETIIILGGLGIAAFLLANKNNVSSVLSGSPTPNQFSIPRGETDFTREDLEAGSNANTGVNLIGDPTVPTASIIWNTNTKRLLEQAGIGAITHSSYPGLTGIPMVEAWALGVSGGSKARWAGIMVSVSKDTSGNVYIS